MNNSEKNRELDLLIIAHFTDDFDINGNNRFNYLARLLSNIGYNVELITSRFSHVKKKKRTTDLHSQAQYTVTYIDEPPYKKNISLKRFWSHFIMSKNLKKYLKKRKKPDVIYCAVPSLDVGNVTAKYAKLNNIRLIIDIQDLWPEAFEMVFNVPVISNVFFFPMKMKARQIYKNANEIVAVSNTYGKVVNKFDKKYHCVYLGTDLSSFDYYTKLDKYLSKCDTEIWIAYIGTLGASYDISLVLNALEILKERNINNIKFIIMGDGPSKSKFSTEAENKSLNVVFTGRLEYKKMVATLKLCDIAVNPIKKRSAGSIINKVADYAAAGLPVVNTQENPEYRDLLEMFNSGINCKAGSVIDVANSIEELIKNEALRKKMSLNSRKLAEEKFDRAITYNTILKLFT